MHTFATPLFLVGCIEAPPTQPPTCSCSAITTVEVTYVLISIIYDYNLGYAHFEQHWLWIDILLFTDHQLSKMGLHAVSETATAAQHTYMYVHTYVVLLDHTYSGFCLYSVIYY